MAVPVRDRPKFGAALLAASEIYPADKNDVQRFQHVATKIGGAVFANICKESSGNVCTILPPGQNQGKWTNTCAVRMSYILNHSGMLLPSVPAKTVKGEDGRNYFFRVLELIKWLEEYWGEPDVVMNRDEYVFGPKLKVKERQGVLLIAPIRGWQDAAGHATLFNGTSEDSAVRYCYDSCHMRGLDSGSGGTVERAAFWELP